MASVREIAQAAGVSPATVSRVLRNSNKVRPETAEKVKRAIEELGNGSPQCRRFSVGLFISPSAFLYNMYLHEVMAGIIRELSDSPTIELRLLLRSDLTDETVSALTRSGIDGVLIVAPTIDSPFVTRVVRSGFPHAIVSSRHDAPQAHWVDCDNLLGMRMLTERAIGLGHTRIAYLAAMVEEWNLRHRLQGFNEAVAEAGITLPEGYIVHYRYRGTLTGFHETQALLSLQPRPTVIILDDDMIVQGVYAALQGAGLRPGEDISVAGFGNQIVCEYVTPALTSVDQAQMRQGSIAVALLRSQLCGEEAGMDRQVLLQPQMVMRTSLLAPPGSHI